MLKFIHYFFPIFERSNMKNTLQQNLALFGTRNCLTNEMKHINFYVMAISHKNYFERKQ